MKLQQMSLLKEPSKTNQPSENTSPEMCSRMFVPFLPFLILFSFFPVACQPVIPCQVFSVTILIFPDLQNQHSMPIQPLPLQHFVSVNKIHFHRLVCPVLYTCSKRIKKFFADVSLYHGILLDFLGNYTVPCYFMDQMTEVSNHFNYLQIASF